MSEPRSFMLEYQNLRTLKIAGLIPTGSGLGALAEITSLKDLANSQMAHAAR